MFIRAGKPALMLIALILLSMPSLAETTCETKNCKITITIKIAFMFDQGVDQSLADKWAKEMEDKWNEGNWVYGDCQCPVTFKVEFIKGNYSAANNCNPPPQGYHCIIVTDYATKPPKDTSGGTYPGYMYPPGISNGPSINGWWSNTMSSPDPSNPGHNYFDAAHEGGHMLGLPDDYNKSQNYYGNNLMGNTSGNGSGINQSMLDQAVENVCGPNACPDHCCCGNGVIDRNKDETCDPMATPTGCGANDFCCTVCCNCHPQMCIPAWGEYDAQSSCRQACTGGQCYYNYKTGCWDCLIQAPVETGERPDPGPGIGNTTQLGNLMKIIEDIIGVINQNADQIPPLITDLVTNKRINVYVSPDMDPSTLAELTPPEGFLFEEPISAGFMTEETEIVQFLSHPYPKPDMEIYMSQSAILDIGASESPESTILTMLLTGKISFTPYSPEDEEIGEPYVPYPLEQTGYGASVSYGLSPEEALPGTVHGPPTPHIRGIWDLMLDLEHNEDLSDTGGVYDDGLMGDLSDLDQVDMPALRQMMQEQEQIMQTLSAIMKNMHDTAKAVIQNMRG